jgi:hypothetical protein
MLIFLQVKCGIWVPTQHCSGTKENQGKPSSNWPATGYHITSLRRMMLRTWHPEHLVLVVDKSEDAVAEDAAGCRCAVEILCMKVPGVAWRVASTFHSL